MYNNFTRKRHYTNKHYPLRKFRSTRKHHTIRTKSYIKPYTKYNNIRFHNIKPYTKYNNIRFHNKKQTKIILGKVFAPWCGHCVELAPIWESLKKDNRMKNYVHFIDINNEEYNSKNKIAEVNRKYNIKLEVNGFPTIFKIKNGKIEYFQEERTLNNIIEWTLL